MKTLQLKDRKNTTDAARAAVVQFINSFNFDAYEDLPSIDSTTFNIYFDATGSGDMQDVAYFSIRECGFCIVSYNSTFRHSEHERTFTKVKSVFDSTCVFINFHQLVGAMENFVSKINAAVESKEKEISDFLKLVEDWNKSREA